MRCSGPKRELLTARKPEGGQRRTVWPAEDSAAPAVPLAGWQPLRAKVIAANGQWPEKGFQACPRILDPDHPSQGHGSRQRGNQSHREGIGSDLLLVYEIWEWHSNALAQGTDKGMSIVFRSVEGWKDPQLC